MWRRYIRDVISRPVRIFLSGWSMMIPRQDTPHQWNLPPPGRGADRWFRSTWHLRPSNIPLFGCLKLLELASWKNKWSAQLEDFWWVFHPYFHTFQEFWSLLSQKHGPTWKRRFCCSSGPARTPQSPLVASWQPSTWSMDDQTWPVVTQKVTLQRLRKICVC